MTPRDRMRPRDILDLGLLALLWGGVYLFIRAAVPAFGPAPLVTLQLGLSALVLLPGLLVDGPRATLRAAAGPLLVQGLLFFALPYLLLAWGSLAMTAGLAAILDATAPLFAALFARIWLAERIGGRRALGLSLGFIGVVVLIGVGAGLGTDAGWAAVAVLAASMLWGLGGLYTQSRLGGLSSLAITAGSLGSAALVLTPLAILDWPATPPGARAWVELMCLAVPCSGCGYLLFYRLVRNVGATRALSVHFLSPPVTVLAGGLYLGESLTAQALTGAAVILAGTTLAFAGGRER